MNKKLVEAINDQIKYEFYSSFIYLAMASYAAEMELAGFESWLMVQSVEEQDHAAKLISYLQSRGEKVVIMGFEDPKNDYSSMLEVFEVGLQHEKSVTSRINNLMTIAVEDKDYASINYLNWFVDEQVEEESNFITIIQKLKMVSESPMGLYQLDKEIAGLRAATQAE